MDSEIYPQLETLKQLQGLCNQKQQIKTEQPSSALTVPDLSGWRLKQE